MFNQSGTCLFTTNKPREQRVELSHVFPEYFVVHEAHSFQNLEQDGISKLSFSIVVYFIIYYLSDVLSLYLFITLTITGERSSSTR